MAQSGWVAVYGTEARKCYEEIQNHVEKPWLTSMVSGSSSE